MLKHRLLPAISAALIAMVMGTGCAPAPDTKNAKPTTGAGSEATTSGPADAGGAGGGATKPQKAPMDPSK